MEASAMWAFGNRYHQVEVQPSLHLCTYNDYYNHMYIYIFTTQYTNIFSYACVNLRNTYFYICRYLVNNTVTCVVTFF